MLNLRVYNFYIHSLKPFLNNGVTCVIFQSFGINLELRDNVYNLANVFAIILYNLGCKSSGPGLLLIFNSFNSLSTNC